MAQKNSPPEPLTRFRGEFNRSYVGLLIYEEDYNPVNSLI